MMIGSQVHHGQPGACTPDRRSPCALACCRAAFPVRVPAMLSLTQK